MIYLISKQRGLFETDLYEEISFLEAKSNLEKLQVIQVDTETAGLDVFTKPLLCYQLGNKENQYVFDQSSYSVELFKDFFESDRLFIFHNASFDLKYLYYYNIWPKHVYDTMLAEQLIWLGYSHRAVSPEEYEDEEYNFPYLEKENKLTHEIYYEYSCSLKAVGKNRLGVELDKTVRGRIVKVGLTPEVIQYAGTDVMHLEDIKDSQQKDIDRENLQKAVDLENEFVKVLAYIEFCGVKLDTNKWKAKMAKDKAKLDKASKELNDFVLNYFNSHNGNIRNKTIISEHITDTQWIHDEEELKKYNIKINLPSKKSKRYYTRNSGIEEVGLLYCEELEIPFPYIEQNLQMDLFQEFDPTPFCNINWKSPKQTIPFFELLGFKLDTFDKKTKQKKKSTDSDTIKSQRSVCPELVDAYIKFKEAAKVCDAFGENWLKAVNPVTKRIHADFHQLGGDTARLSCGGGEASVNVQQLPRDAETRACFVSEPGNLFISEDYMAQESRLLASVTNDPALIELYTTGCGDLHSLTAYMSFPNRIPRDTRIEDIKHLFPQERQEAKSIEFAIGYGGDFNTLANNNGLPLEEAKKIYDDYMKGFPGVKKYQDYCRKEVIKKGYILMNPVTGHRAHIEDWNNRWKKIRDFVNQPGFYEEFNRMKKYDPYSKEVYWIRQWFKKKSDLEKQSINYRIQNRGACCFKLSAILLFKWIIKNNYQNIVKICVPAHDEFDCECPANMAEEFALVLQKCMENGAKPFCTRLPLSSDLSRLEDGSIPNYWLH